MALRFCTEGARSLGLASLSENQKEKQKLVSKCNDVKAVTPGIKPGSTSFVGASFAPSTPRTPDCVV